MSILLAVIGSFPNVPPFTSTNTAYSANATVTIPSGATTLKINCYGKGGDGGFGSFSALRGGGGGGGGGHARKTLTVSSNAGQTFNVVINASGSYVTSGTYSLTTVQGLIGQNGTAGGANVGVGGAGGAASGGDTNVTGTAGVDGTVGGNGGNGGGCDVGGTDPGGSGGNGGYLETSCNLAFLGEDGIVPGGGAGGGAGNYSKSLGPTAGGSGAAGRVVITFT